MKLKLVKKWLFRVILAQIALSIPVFIWFDYQIDDMWGAHTVVVDHTKFNIAQELIAIENVNVLSADGTAMLADKTVIIDRGKIQSISSSISPPANALLVDGQGKYLIPGLIDSHVHLWQSPNDLLLYLANGVTQVRELNGSEDHLQWREEIENGRMGPRLFVASSRINSNGRLKGWFDSWTAKTTNIDAPEGAETVVKSFSSNQFDAVKVYSYLSKEDFFAVNKAAEKLNIPILGHIPMSVKLEDIWNSSLKELAHIEEFVKALDREFGGYNSSNTEQFLQFVQTRGGDVANNLKKNNMAVVTTLWLMESFAKQRHDIHTGLSEVELAYVNPGITELSPIASKVMGWLPNSNIYRISHDHPNDVLEGDKNYWNTYAKANQILLQAMLQKGVVVLAGTDANVPIAVPGFSMHDELMSLTNAGMSPSQALLTATAAPANWMKIKSGKIAEGYNADLVLLDANPLIR
ncbi:MAG: amidohydrolase family protein [Kangiellaceae bacterium]|nr:amidohydrolase family protein [Kangiellaceae bacterium]